MKINLPFPVSIAEITERFASNREPALGTISEPNDPALVPKIGALTLTYILKRV